MANKLLEQVRRAMDAKGERDNADEKQAMSQSASSIIWYQKARMASDDAFDAIDLTALAAILEAVGDAGPEQVRAALALADSILPYLVARRWMESARR